MAGSSSKVDLSSVVYSKSFRSQENQSSKTEDGHPTCHSYTLAEIQSATENFHEKFILGKGGNGVVYKGNLGHGDVAIKRLSNSFGGDPEFRKEIEIGLKIRHCRLVSFLGYCDEQGETILVYEYMSRGSLWDCLYQNSIPLSWDMRLTICINVAEGLEYLHRGIAFDKRILHSDIKSANILLDNKFEAKLADFGLSTLTPIVANDNGKKQENFGYTRGYVAPECERNRRLTVEADIYSFGVVLLEVMCGKKVLDRVAQETISKKKELHSEIDPMLLGQISDEVLKKFAAISLKCLHTEPKKRPTLFEVLVVLRDLKFEYASRVETSEERHLTSDTKFEGTYLTKVTH